MENADFYHLSLVIRKPSFCMRENKDADQLRGNREADQRLCFRYLESTIPLLPKYEISSLKPSSVAVQPGLCQTWSETPKTGFLRTRLIWESIFMQVLLVCVFNSYFPLFADFTKIAKCNVEIIQILFCLNVCKNNVSN